MATINEPQSKKPRLNSESGVSISRSSTTSQNNKFELLLSTTFGLNKSKSKNVIVGLQLDYDTKKLRPMVGIVDQKNKGILLSESSWSDIVGNLDKIHDFFTMTNVKNFSEKIVEPILLRGISLTFNNLSFNFMKSKAICIRERTDSPNDGIEDSELPAVIMQQVTFDTMKDLAFFISEYLEYLDSIIPCVEDSIKLLIDLTKDDMVHIQGKSSAKPWDSAILGMFMRNCVRRSDIHMKIIDKVSTMNTEMTSISVNCLITELFTYHEEFLMKNIFD